MVVAVEGMAAKVGAMGVKAARLAAITSRATSMTTDLDVETIVATTMAAVVMTTDARVADLLATTAATKVATTSVKAVKATMVAMNTTTDPPEEVAMEEMTTTIAPRKARLADTGGTTTTIVHLEVKATMIDPALVKAAMITTIVPQEVMEVSKTDTALQESHMLDPNRDRTLHPTMPLRPATMARTVQVNQVVAMVATILTMMRSWVMQARMRIKASSSRHCLS